MIVPELPRSMLIDEGDALIVKLEGALVIVREIVTSSVMLPDVPVTLMR